MHYAAGQVALHPTLISGWSGYKLVQDVLSALGWGFTLSKPNKRTTGRHLLPGCQLRTIHKGAFCHRSSNTSQIHPCALLRYSKAKVLARHYGYSESVYVVGPCLWRIVSSRASAAVSGADGGPHCDSTTISSPLPRTSADISALGDPSICFNSESLMSLPPRLETLLLGQVD